MSTQKLIDACFQIGLMISDPKYDLRDFDDEKKAEWIAKQLELVGFPTHQVGSSWGVLDKPKAEAVENPTVHERTYSYDKWGGIVNDTDHDRPF